MPTRGDGRIETVENQVVCARVLSNFAVNSGRQLPVMRIESVASNHPRPHRPVGIPRLAHQHCGASARSL